MLSATTTLSRRQITRTAIRNTRRRWIGSWHCRSPIAASKRSCGTTRYASTRCSWTMNIGFIGDPIAGQLLQAGHALVVHDVRPEAANALLTAGAAWSSSPAALAADYEVVATC